MDLFDLDPEDCIEISAKNGTNIKAVLDSVVERIPPPKLRKSFLVINLVDFFLSSLIMQRTVIIAINGKLMEKVVLNREGQF